MDLDGLAFHEHGLKRLDAEAMKRRRAVEKNRVVLDDLFEDVPDDGFLLLDHLLGLLDGGAVTGLLEAVIDEGLEELERHLFGQAALMEFQFGADDDDGAAGIIDTLAEQVLAEAALLALEGVRERLERTVLAPRSTRPRRPLSNRASTASCSMRFSLRTMTSGACRSMSFLRRLLRLMTRR